MRAPSRLPRVGCETIVAVHDHWAADSTIEVPKSVGNASKMACLYRVGFSSSFLLCWAVFGPKLGVRKTGDGFFLLWYPSFQGRLSCLCGALGCAATHGSAALGDTTHTTLIRNEETRRRMQ